MFWIGLIVGIFIGAIIGFFVAALCAVSGRASRAEEERGDYFSSKQMVADVEDILGRKIG